MTYYVALGAAPEKLVVGMPLYGRGYKIVDAAQHGPGIPAHGSSAPAQYTRETGVYSYYEVRVDLSGQARKLCGGKC